MHPPPPAAAMDFSQNSLFGYMEDLQELTIIERPVRRSLKVRAPGRRNCPQGARRPAGAPTPIPSHPAPPRPEAAPVGVRLVPQSASGRRVTLNRPFPGPLLRRSPASPSLAPLLEGRAPGSVL